LDGGDALAALAGLSPDRRGRNAAPPVQLVKRAASPATLQGRTSKSAAFRRAAARYALSMSVMARRKREGNS
jgi:hypothetical protein